MTERPLCPRCTARLEVVTDSCYEVEYLPTNPRRGARLPTKRIFAPFVACPACEFCMALTEVAA
jgi:hypothetical protein